MADLKVDLCGNQLTNPLIAASGPLGYSARGINRLFAKGAAGAVTKTIAPVPAENPTPHILALGGGNMLNSEKWADLSIERWVDEEFPQLADSQGIVIGSLGHSPESVGKLVPKIVEPNVVKLLEVTSYHAEDMAPMVKVVKSCTDVPVFIKACGDWDDFYGVIDECVEAGVDGVTAGDAFGPVLHIDIEKAKPAMGGVRGYARLSGPAIRLMWVRIVADLRMKYPELPIVATGGVTTANDVVEMLMAGATAIGACTAPMLKGPEWFQKTTQKLNSWLDLHNYESVEAIRGIALPYMLETEDKSPLSFDFSPDKCTDCCMCAIVCPYEARHVNEKKMLLDGELCRSCGLCVSVCPTHALTAAGI